MAAAAAGGYRQSGNGIVMISWRSQHAGGRADRPAGRLAVRGAMPTQASAPAERRPRAGRGAATDEPSAASRHRREGSQYAPAQTDWREADIIAPPTSRRPRRGSIERQASIGRPAAKPRATGGRLAGEYERQASPVLIVGNHS